MPPLSAVPPFDHCNRHPRDPNHTRYHPIGDFAVAGVAAEAQTQATVDDSQGDEGPTKGDMRKCPDARLALTDIRRVMELTQDGLDGEEDDDDNADDGMVVVNLTKLRSVDVSLFRDPSPLRRSTNLSIRFKSDVHA